MPDPDPLDNLPAWPKEAKDLPGDKPLAGPAHKWVFLLAAGGFVVGGFLGLMRPGHGSAEVAADATVAAFLGLFAGYFVDRAEWQAATRRRKD